MAKNNNNVVTGNARVGFQADEVTITGGLTISFPAGSRRSRDARDGGATQAVQEGPANVAGDGDVIGMQVGRITRKGSKS